MVAFLGTILQKVQRNSTSVEKKIMAPRIPPCGCSPRGVCSFALLAQPGRAARLGQRGPKAVPLRAPFRAAAHQGEPVEMKGTSCKMAVAQLRRFWSMFPLTRVPFWYRFFEPYPNVCKRLFQRACPVKWGCLGWRFLASLLKAYHVYIHHQDKSCASWAFSEKATLSP